MLKLSSSAALCVQQTFSIALSLSSAARICSHKYTFSQQGGGGGGGVADWVLEATTTLVKCDIQFSKDERRECTS